MSELPLEPIASPAVENYRALTRQRRVPRPVAVGLSCLERRTLVGLASALLAATLLLLLLAVSANAEERPFIWPQNDEVVDSDGPWKRLEGEAAEEIVRMEAPSGAPRDDGEVNR